MNETIDITSKEMWERAKEIYLSTLHSVEEKSQVDRYLSMILSVSRKGENFIVLTSNAYAADYLKDNYSERLRKCLELVADGEKMKNTRLKNSFEVRPTAGHWRQLKALFQIQEKAVTIRCSSMVELALEKHI